LDRFRILKSDGTKQQFTPTYLCRSLDVLHVAAACLLEVREFASFDIRQRKLAAGVGLQPLPEILP
jgi:hypothetical protein